MTINDFGPLEPKKINKAEKELSIKLPSDYVDFLISTNGGVLEKDDTNKILIPAIDQYIVLDVLFGIETGNKNADILYWMDQYSDDMFANSIIIGDDLLNGFIVMICDGDDKGIYYWDDAYHFEESNDENNMYRIADSFSDFLGLLK